MRDEAKVSDPKPGTDEAVAAGCTCAVADNCHGRGFMWDFVRRWWVKSGCPVHDPDDAIAKELGR